MPAPSKLNLDQIVDEAIVLLREEGLDEVTLRKLAARLGVEAPSLYRHIGGKPRLQALITLKLFRMQLDQVGMRSSWQEWLVELGRMFWTTQGAIPDCARLVLTTKFEPEQLSTMSDWAAAALVAHGIDRATAFEMHLSVQAFVLGLGGLADGPNTDFMRRTMPLDAILDHTLSALVSGWEARLAGMAATAS